MKGHCLVPELLATLFRNDFSRTSAFTDETAACMVWTEAISFMLLPHAKWRGFTSRPIPPNVSSEVMLAPSYDSRDAVDE